MSARYPELEKMHCEFSRALVADAAPLGDAASLWHELLGYDADAAQRAMSRGNAFLRYRRGPKELTDVPGQQFTEDKLPHQVCVGIMNEHGGSKDGPRLISFRYDRAAHGGWKGGYTIETQQEYFELVKGRKTLDSGFTDMLRKQMTQGVKRVSINFNEPSWEEPGPKLIIGRVDQQGATFSDLDGELRQLWNDLLEYLRGHGVRHLYYAKLGIHKITDTLREGNGIQLSYCR